MRVVAPDASVPTQVESLNSDFPSRSYEILCMIAKNWVKSGLQVATLGLILELLTEELEVKLNIKVVGCRLIFPMTLIL